MTITKWLMLNTALIATVLPLTVMANDNIFIFKHHAQRDFVTDELCEEYGGEARLLKAKQMNEIGNLPGAADGVVYYGDEAFVIYVALSGQTNKEHSYRLCTFSR